MTITVTAVIGEMSITKTVVIDRSASPSLAREYLAMIRGDVDPANPFPMPNKTAGPCS